MTKRMLIDAAHPEETRVVVINDGQLEEFEFESSTKKQLKGNIYLAKVTRVEPSLQAAFVDYGGQRHGFLAFSEIHPDYYQIPRRTGACSTRPSARSPRPRRATAHAEEAEEGGSEAVATDPEEEAAEVFDEQAKRRSRLLRSYKIQEVIKRRQILLVQVVKEERGNKGAALTTYLSLAGRYSVLMPNTPRGGGISRKIANPADRSRLKAIARELEVPEGMGLIIRTAGQERNKLEIRRDYEYSLRLWNDIRERTLQSIAPCTIHEEGALVKRAIRDLYARDIDEVLVEGEEGLSRGAQDHGHADALAHAAGQAVQGRGAAVPSLRRRRTPRRPAQPGDQPALGRLGRDPRHRGADRDRRQFRPLDARAQHRGDRAQDQSRGRGRGRAPAAAARHRRARGDRLHRHGRPAQSAHRRTQAARAPQGRSCARAARSDQRVRSARAVPPAAAAELPGAERPAVPDLPRLGRGPLGRVGGAAGCCGRSSWRA